MSKPRPQDVSLPRDSRPGWPTVPTLSAVGAAAFGVFVWVGLFFGGMNWLAPLGIGALIGLAVMFTDRGDARMPWVAAGLTVVSCWIGYVVVDQFFYWQQSPPLGRSVLAFVQNMQAALMTLIGAYLAWLVAGRAGKSAGGGAEGVG